MSCKDQLISKPKFNTYNPMASSAVGTNDESSTTMEKPSPCNTRKTIILWILLILITCVIVDTFTSQIIATGIDDVLDWIGDNPGLGIFVFASIYIVATVLFIPGSILTLGAGFAFTSATGSTFLGVVLGSVSVLTGASIGATLAFLLGRYLLRDSVIGWISPSEDPNAKMSTLQKTWGAIDQAMNKEGLKIMLLLRLSPVIPFNVLNYAAGTTAISLSSYVISMVGIAPGTILFVYLGASASDLSSAGDGGGTVRIIFLLIGAVFGLVGVFVASYYAKRELNLVLEEKEKALGGGV